MVVELWLSSYRASPKGCMEKDEEGEEGAAVWSCDG
jgi:hypothetical protein